MRSTAEVLEGNKVKLSVEVDETELAEAVSETVRRLQHDVRVPGFRPGKVPRRLLEQRLGPKAIREEVIRHSLPEYYAQAVEEAALDTIDAPEIDITTGEEEGPLAFDAVVEVRPRASIAGYEGLQVTLPNPEATEEEIDSQIDRLRENFAELTEVSRPAKTGDVVTIDVTATRDGEPVEDLSTSDFVYEVGREMVAPGIDEKLVGAKTGDIVEVEAPEAPGGAVTVKVLVKLVREKVLPETTDDWASEASEFDTVEELRNDLRTRLSSVRRLQARLALQEGAVAELAKLVEIEVPETLVNQEIERISSNFVQRLSERRFTPEQYFEASGQSEEDLLADFRTQAVERVKTDLALRALADAEQLEVSDEDLASEITAYAGSIGQPVAAVARQFAEGPGLERLRSEIRNSKAATWLVEHVELLDEQGNPMDRALLGEEMDSVDGGSSVETAAPSAGGDSVDENPAGATEEEQA